MYQRFDPYGTVRSRPEFEAYDSAASPQKSVIAGGRKFLDELLRLADAFDLDDAIFFLAHELVTLQPDLPEQDRRDALLLVLATLISSRQGSTCLPLGPPLISVLDIMLSEEIRGETGLSPDLLAARLDRLLRAGKLGAIVAERGDDFDYKPLVLDAGKLYHQRMLHYEGLLIDALNERFVRQIASIQTDGIAQHLPSIWRGPTGLELTAEQRYAVLTAVHIPFSIITGGPGTGKTSIVVSLLRLLVRLGVDPSQVSLAAPTGKAANRMAESITSQLRASDELEQADLNLLASLPRPQTLHRLLGYSRYSHQYHHHEHNPLDRRVVIVDEASMIDMFLMQRLVRATRDDTHVILMGDIDQLPSVDAGAVLRDLAAPLGANMTPWRDLLDVPPPEERGEAKTARFTVRLTRSHRMSADDPQGRHILKFAQRVRDGRSQHAVGPGEDQLHPMETLEQVLGGGAQWYALAPKPGSDALLRGRLSAFVEQWYEEVVRAGEDPGILDRHIVTGFEEERLVDEAAIAHVRRCFERMQRARLLALTRNFVTGTRALNEALLERLRRELGARASAEFVPGTPVMMTRNDYEKEIFNGDQGVVLPARVLGKHELVAFFPQGEGFVGYGVDGLRSSLEVSFAMTVHKSQGSEFDHIALVLPPESIPLLTREVVYTAVTRSRRGALVLGIEEVLEASIAAKMMRYSSLDSLAL